MASGWEVGQVVQLRSGGPRMTICDVLEGGSVVECIWSDGKVEHVRKYNSKLLCEVDDSPVVVSSPSRRWNRTF